MIVPRQVGDYGDNFTEPKTKKTKSFDNKKHFTNDRKVSLQHNVTSVTAILSFIGIEVLNSKVGVISIHSIQKKNQKLFLWKDFQPIKMKREQHTRHHKKLKIFCE